MIPFYSMHGPERGARIPQARGMGTCKDEADDTESSHQARTHATRRAVAPGGAHRRSAGEAPTGQQGVASPAACPARRPRVTTWGADREERSDQGYLLDAKPNSCRMR